MTLSGRRLLLAALATTLLVPAGPADAACAVDARICQLVGEPTDLDPGTDGDGTLCLYIKQSSPPPSDWTGGESDGPYFFWRTQAWGDSPEHRHTVDWDRRGCVPACTVSPTHVALSCAPGLGFADPS